jgi:hypothetical protein
MDNAVGQLEQSSRAELDASRQQHTQELKKRDQHVKALYDNNCVLERDLRKHSEDLVKLSEQYIQLSSNGTQMSWLAEIEDVVLVQVRKQLTE